MKQKLIKDRAVRINFKKIELKNITLKILLRSKIFSYIEIYDQYSYIKKNASITKIHDRCNLTSRARSVNKLARLSRIKLKELGKTGFITGMKKLSW